MTKNHQPKHYTKYEAQLVPEITEWNNGAGISIEDWIACVGSYEHAIGYSTIFWPKFVLYDECLLRASFSIKNYQDFVTQTKGNKQAVESVINHIHLTDLFSTTEQPPSEAQLIYLGRMLKEMWQAKLGQEFPELKIIVSFEEENIEWLEDFILTVYQE